VHLDTSFLIDLQRERERRQPGPCHRFLEQHAGLPMRISSVTAMEYLEGLPDSDLPGQLPFLSAFDRVAVDFPESLQASRIRRYLRSAGELLPDADILIAACAIHQNEPLVTDNTDHFHRIPGLQLLSYKS
jgi:predicted nucleic acid-binding protein